MSERLRIKFLTVIWGARYIEEFARIALPTYLAEGNLPTVAREANLEIVIMTSSDSVRAFDEEPLFRRLKALCSVRFINIDDLIATGVYGVTLTLAYARGISDSGPLQTQTHFVFLNSDFVLADGSLRTLVGKLQEGHRCVMAPSLRACSEAVLPTLRTAANAGGGTLAIAPRDLVKLAFDNLHPTVVGKTITQEFVSCVTHNQIYWQVDKNTLLGRYYLMFMLAIKPEVSMGLVNSYCDYGFVPELVPSGQFTILDDSDEFFMLELQAEAQENEMLRCGPTTLGRIASRLSLWTTREHRRFAECDVIFHTSDLPPEVEKTRREVTEFIGQLRRKLKKPKKPQDHTYWTSGVQAWARMKYGRRPERIEFPPELSPPRRNRYMSYIDKIRRLIGLQPHLEPNVPLWSYLWLDYRLILKWASQIGARSSEKNLLIYDPISPLAPALSSLMPLDIEMDQSPVAEPAEPQTAIEELTVAHKSAPRGGTDAIYDNILIHIYEANLRRTRGLVSRAMKRLKPNGTVSIYIQYLGGESYASNFTWELAHCINNVLAADWIGYRITARFAGGKMKRWLRRAETRLFGYLMPTSMMRIPLVVLPIVGWPIVAMLIALNNLRFMNRSNSCPEYCSSALISVMQPPTMRGDIPGMVPATETVQPARLRTRATVVGGVQLL